MFDVTEQLRVYPTLLRFLLCVKSSSSGGQSLDCALPADCAPLPAPKAPQSLSKAMSTSCLGHSQRSGLRKLLYHSVNTAGFSQQNQAKLRLKSSLGSVPHFPNRTELESLPNTGPRYEKQVRDLICTRCKVGDKKRHH